MPDCSSLQRSLAWCQGRPELPGVRRRIYYISKYDILKWPTLPHDANGRLIGSAYQGDFTLRADASWKFIDIIPDKSQLTSDPQGEYPSQTQLNKLVAVHPSVGAEASAAAAYLNNNDNVFLVEWLSGENGFTDDTICTVAVADALLHDRDFGESIHDWCRHNPNPMGGYGGRFALWVHSDSPVPYNSYGNGSAMRVSPVAYWYDNIDEVLDAAAATALPSHNHDEGIKGAQTVALAIFKARQFGSDASEHIDDILEECVRFSNYDINVRKEDVINHFDETCQGTVPVALWIIGLSDSFEDAVRKAVSLGADADTLGAIVGSIAETIWGIPEETKLAILDYLPDDMKEVVSEFYEHINK